MNPHKTLSSYLVKPNLSHRRLSPWGGFRTELMHIKRANPRLLSRTVVALGIWCALVASIQYVSQPNKQLPGQTAFTNAGQAMMSGGPGSFNPTQNLPALQTVAHAQALPSGPSGQLLPPGTMAADNAFRNNYAKGQCTWYVAGRRQIPGDWGHAKTWYYNATASGWSVGTTPAIAAIAWTPSGYYGHVALVEKISADGSQVYISEMNYRGLGVKSFRWVSSKAFKYIY